MSAFDAFVTVHQYQLSAIPKELWETLFMKLGEDYLDAGSTFELHYGDDIEGYSLHAKTDLAKESNIFLIDHAWTTTPENAKKEIKSSPGLLDRLETIMDIEKEDVVDSDDENEIEEDSDMIDVVAEQANVSREKARKALIAQRHDLVSAIMHLTMSEEFKAESDRLQDQVMGQLIASGKEERRKQREKEVLERRINRVYSKMWTYNQTYQYSVVTPEGTTAVQSVWYMNDEVGSAITHASEPNCVMLPFIFSRGHDATIPYSVLFPIKDITHGEMVTRDFIPKDLKEPLQRQAYLTAFPGRIANEEEIGSEDDFIDAYEETTKASSELPPSKSINPVALLKIPTTQNVEIKVYTTADFVKQNLTLPHITFTNSLQSADIIWVVQDFSDWDKLQPNQRISQIPNESCLTYKNNLAQLLSQTYGQVSWFPQTYNLINQLPAFVGNYLQRSHKLEDIDNLWITKPWNYARGMDISIAETLPQAIRQRETVTPKIVQEYIDKPLLYRGRKFDLRYIVLLQQTQPMIACVYNMFWIRLANKKYDKHNVDDYEKHFTVMNYTNYQMTQIHYLEFIRNIEKEHKDLRWASIQNDINTAIKGKMI
ncbi:tubulin-tyrosine ligase family-domain-containing protein [Umbelopsis sp. PMI_123]|nr:tubulin-tyrosine ligase family-domain-containing protein [Umbelopsis sp. PMI_123]